MRQKDLSTSSFRRLLHEISMLMAYEVTRDMPTHLIDIETPLAKMRSPVIEGRKTVFVVVMRAGNGFPGRDAGSGARCASGPCGAVP
jgi:uracil phosphoribosyltransferase